MVYYWVDFIIFGSYECPTCGVEKPRSSEHFGRDRAAADGLHRECRDCRAARDVKRYREDDAYREKRRAKSRQKYSERKRS